jgi:hypothetical protein
VGIVINLPEDLLTLEIECTKIVLLMNQDKTAYGVRPCPKGDQNTGILITFGKLVLSNREMERHGLNQKFDDRRRQGIKPLAPDNRSLAG